MELELGLKITHKRDDLTSNMTDLRITKDLPGPLFMSTETDSKFFLIGHLEGFRRENIDIEINGAGNKIAISGKKPVQEMVLKGWIMCRKEVEIRAFRKIFRIPDGVILDKIKAKLNDELSTLTISMPKLIKGICGFGIEEVKEVKEEGIDRGRPETVEPVAEKVPEIEKAKQEIQQESKKSTEVQEMEQVVTRDVGTSKPETDKVVAGQVPEKESDLEAPEEETIEQKNEGMEDSGQVSEQASDQGKSETIKEVAEEFPERYYSMGTVKEKPEETMEEIGSEVQQLHKGESRTLANEAGQAAERVEESVQKESKETEVKSTEEKDHQFVETSQGRPELEPRATIEKVEPEPPIRTEMNQETASEEAHESSEKESDHSQITEFPPTKEAQREELPEERSQMKESEEQVRSSKKIESTYPGVSAPTERLSSPATQIEEEEEINENHQVENENPEEAPKQEPEAERQESTKPESRQEPEQQETLHRNNLADQSCKDEVHGKEKTQENEITEPGTREKISEEKVDDRDSQESEQQKGPSEEAAQMKKPVTEKSKVYPPLMVAGSALLVSLIVLVIHFIRAKNR